jgi:hypothetical protein
VITVDGYADLQRIGHGGLGDVYRATRESTGSTVAIKVLRDVSDESVAWHRTRRELTALVSLSGHAHVIQLLELLDLPEGPALVMEYAPGGSVADLLGRRESTLSVAEAVLIGRHTADALIAAHEQDIVHRDLKPQNLLIDTYGRIKLCDFGIASLARSDDFRTRTNALSLRYASPEDLDDDAEVGPPSDVYSLGATVLHLVHGSQLSVRDRLQPWTAPATDDPELAELDRIVERCLRPDPEERPSSPDLLDQLEAIDWTLAERCRGLPVEEPTAASAKHDGDPGDLADTGGPDLRGAVVPSVGVAARVEASFGHDRPVGPPDAAAVPGTDAIGDDAGTRDDTSSTTVRRSDAVVPPHPEPEATESDPRRWPWVLGALAGAAAVGVIGAFVWPSADEVSAPVDEMVGANVATTTPPPGGTTAPTSTAAITLVARPDGLPPLDDPSITWPFGPTGECLVQVNGLDELMPVECAQPHDLQRFDVDELDATDVPEEQSTMGEIQTITDAACRDAFVGFVGLDEPDSVFHIAITRPSADSWADGDRRFQCLLGVPDRHVMGDAESSLT